MHKKAINKRISGDEVEAAWNCYRDAYRVAERLDMNLSSVWTALRRRGLMNYRRRFPSFTSAEDALIVQMWNSSETGIAAVAGFRAVYPTRPPGSVKARARLLRKKGERTGKPFVRRFSNGWTDYHRRLAAASRKVKAKRSLRGGAPVGCFVPDGAEVTP